MQLIIVTKTNYGYRAETANKSLPNESQLKRVNKYIHSKQVKENSFNNFSS